MLKHLLIACVAFVPALALAQELPYTNQTELTVLVGTQTSPALSAQTFNGVRVKNLNLEMGIAAGVDAYENMVVLPISIGFKWNPLAAKSVSPYISFNAGYGFDWLQRKIENTWYEGGYMLAAQAGIRIKTKTRARISAGLGFRQQFAAMHQNSFFFDFRSRPSGQDYSSDLYTFRRVSVSVGLSF